jgi:hypothetical protein
MNPRTQEARDRERTELARAEGRELRACERCDGTGEVYAASFTTPLPAGVGHVVDGPELVRCIECGGDGWDRID